MPITVIVLPLEGDGAPISSLTFDGMQRVVIGRGPGSDVRLPDPSVTHRHATLRAQGGDFVLFDEGSTNGTFVGSVPIAPQTSRIVRSGDKVRVGRLWLGIRIDATAVTRDVATATRDLALALVARTLEARGADTTLRVTVMEGPDQGATLALQEEGREYLIGRGPQCDLPLADPDASREHAAVVRRGAAATLRDLGGKNGTRLGEARIEAGRETAWRPSLMVRMGRTVLALEEPVASALAEAESVTDEEMPPEAPPAAAPEPAADGLVRGRSAADAPPPTEGPSGAQAPGPGPKRPVARRGRWSIMDLVVMSTALAILGLSLAGLAWLLRAH
jgi:pSer/pThr/pTyr-binding forkhead associated (FHA) protein